MAQATALANALPQTAAATAVQLTLRNPSPYPRGGLVITPWQPVAARLGDPQHVRVFQNFGFGSRTELPAQIDRLDPRDPSRDELVFWLIEPVSRGDEHYKTACGSVDVEAASSPSQVWPGGPRAKALYDGAELTHDKFYVWLNTSTNHDCPNNHWFGGAIAGVKWDGRDLLDPIAEDWGFDLDLDRRAAQIDRIHLVRPPWDEDGSFDEYVFDKPWTCETTCEGPLRATATIVSQQFPFGCRDADQQPRTFTCRVHRTVGILRGSEAITDKIWVTGDVAGPPPAVPMWFSARYFTLVNLSLGSIKFRYPDHPGWFAVVATDSRAHHGYAFATDSNAGPIWHPPLEHKNPTTGHRAYSWELGARRIANSAHILRRDTNMQALTDTIGWTWYDLIYKPMSATL